MTRKFVGYPKRIRKIFKIKKAKKRIKIKAREAALIRGRQEIRDAERSEHHQIKKEINALKAKNSKARKEVGVDERNRAVGSIQPSLTSRGQVFLVPGEN